MTTVVDYGYGDAVPDSSGENYDYGDVQPDYVYGNGDPSTSDKIDCGYGDSQPSANKNDTTDYGYGDAEPDYGYGDGSPEEENNGDGDQPKRRNRRRNSVTRYSIAGQDTVKNEFDAHANVIDQFRNDSMNAPCVGPLPEQACAEPVDGAPRGYVSDDCQSLKGSLGDDSEHDGKDKTEKKKRGWSFRLGRANTSP